MGHSMTWGVDWRYFKMNTLLQLIALACVVACASAVIGTTCTTEQECDDGECCQILSEFMVVSRRQLAKAPRAGTCQRYKTEGDHCGPFGKMNGYCSCGPTLSCQSTPDPNYHPPVLMTAAQWSWLPSHT